MSFKTTYDISPEGIRNLELISKVDGNLQVLKMNPDWSRLLERQARVAESVASIGVEGTVVSLDQARAITAGKDDGTIGEREKREFVAYFDSLEFIKTKADQPLTVSTLLAIHERVTAGDIRADPGKIRDDLRHVKRDGKIIFTAPPPDQLTFLLKEFIAWFNEAADNKSLSPIVAAAVCHFWFVWVHPFKDGNGRTARLLTTLMLLRKHSEGVKYFALSDFYNKHQAEYYDVLQRTNVCDPLVPAMNFASTLTPWVNFFIGSYRAQIDEIKPLTDRILQLNIRIEKLRSLGKITKSQNPVITFLFSREKASYDELEKLLGVTQGRVTQIIKSLREHNLLVEEKIGKTLWFSLGAPDNEPDADIFKPKLKTHRARKKSSKPVKQPVLPIFS